MGMLFDKSVLQQVVASVIYALLCSLVSKIFDRLSVSGDSRFSFSTKRKLFTLTVCWLVFNLTILCYDPTFFPVSLAITSIILVIFLTLDISCFWNVGLTAIDRSVKSGLNYDQSLKSCKNQLNFLGIGASKLIQSSEFESALRRCHHEKVPIIFLLSHPENKLLLEAANRKGVSDTDYKQLVVKSLQELASLRNQKKLNIEVYLYGSKKRVAPLFRLMFINKELCLASYNVFGEGDGSQLPQLHAQRLSGKRETASFYYPFQIYFENLKEESKKWDFQFPIK